MSIGEKLSYYMRQTGLTQKQLSEMSGLSQSYISKILRDKADPTAENIKSLCKSLHITPNELLLDDSAFSMGEMSENEIALMDKIRSLSGSDFHTICSMVEFLCSKNMGKSLEWIRGGNAMSS